MARTGRGRVKIPGIVKLLFETPSGFAIFSFDEKYLEKKIEDIWIYFVGNYWHQNIVWLHEFRAFEDKPNVINLTAQTINPSLIKMLWMHCHYDDTLVVGSHAYKDLIQRKLSLNCRYDDAMNEVMWGLQNLMHILVPKEQSKFTKDDRLPMSKGLNMVLTRHEIYIKHEMLNECIIKKTSKLYDAELREKAHSKFLHKNFDGNFKNSSVDSKDWSLIQLATAVKIMFDPHGGLKMFLQDELTSITRDAHLYEQTVDKDLILAVYDDVVTLQEGKAELLTELRSLVQEAKSALETEELQENPATNGVDSKKDEGQHGFITGAVGEDILPPSDSAGPVLHSKQEGDLHTSSIFSVAPQVVPRSTLPTSQEINALSTGVKRKIHENETEDTTAKRGNAIPDEDNVKNHTIEGKVQDPEIIAEGRKRPKGIESVNNLEEQEQRENSSDKKTNAIEDGAHRAAAEMAIPVENKECGNASAKQNGAHRAEGESTEDSQSEGEHEGAEWESTEDSQSEGEHEGAEGESTEDSQSEGEHEGAKSLDNFEEKELPGNSSEETNVIIAEGRKRPKGIESVNNLEEQEQRENSSDKKTNAIEDGAHRAAAEMAIPVENKECGNASVKQNGAHRAEGESTEDSQSEGEHEGAEWESTEDSQSEGEHEGAEGESTEDSQIEGEHKGAKSLDNFEEKELPGNSSEETNVIEDGVGTAVELATHKEKKECGNASVKQNGAHKAKWESTEDSQSEREHEGTKSLDNLKEKEQSETNSGETIAIEDGAGTAIETAIPVEKKECGNASVKKQNGTHRADEGESTEDSQNEGEHEGAKSFDNVEEKELPGNSSEETNVIEDERTAVETAIRKDGDIGGSERIHVSFGELLSFKLPSSEDSASAEADKSGDDKSKDGKRRLGLFSYFGCFKS